MTIDRRAFITAAAAGAAGSLFARRAAALGTQTGDSRLEILVNEPIGTIAPDLHGHFVEHLGGVVYDGIWVGDNSKVPNINGIRKALVDELKKIKPPVIRWPGGCFADDWYDLLTRADRMESLVTTHWSAMAESDPTHKVKLTQRTQRTQRTPRTPNLCVLGVGSAPRCAPTVPARRRAWRRDDSYAGCSFG